MSTRVTTGMLSQRVLADLHRVNERMVRSQTQISSGKAIQRPSDDPFGTSRAMVLRENLDGVEQFQRNVEDARGWQDAAESAMTRMSDAVQRTRELVIQGGNGSADQSARDAIAQEIDELAESLKEFANASYKDQYIFGGVRTDAPPYGQTPAGDVSQAQPGPVARQIGPGVSVAINVDLGAVLGNGAGDDRLLHVLRDIATHLRTGDGAALRTTDLERLDAGFATLLDARALNGARSNRLDAALGRLAELEEASIAQLSATEDVDIAEALIGFSSQQAAYQAALKAGANIVQSSLMDFLR